MIYEICLLHDGEINPHPTDYERIEIKFKGGVPAKMMSDHILNPSLKSPVKYSRQWPSVALLGVNKAIQDEAATILFGKNVWRLSGLALESRSMSDLWENYRKYFLHVTTSFDMRDITPPQLMYITNVVSKWRIEKGKNIEVSDSGDTGLSTHNCRIKAMRANWNVKRSFLEGMQLKSLVFDIRNLFCPSGCCRFSIIKQFCEHLGTEGQWSRLWQKSGRSLSTAAEFDAEAVTRTDIKIVGLKVPEERRPFQKLWGLDLEDLSEIGMED